MTDSQGVPQPSIRARLVNSLFMGATGAALTLIDPAKLRPGTKAGLYIGTGTVTAALGWVASFKAIDPAPSKAFRAAAAAGLGAISVAGTKFGFVIDAKIHQALLRRGIADPRRIMAVGAGVITTAMVLLESPRPDNEPENAADHAEDPATTAELN